jgi:hypothetical protein
MSRCIVAAASEFHSTPGREIYRFPHKTHSKEHIVSTAQEQEPEEPLALLSRYQHLDATGKKSFVKSVQKEDPGLFVFDDTTRRVVWRLCPDPREPDDQ